MPRLHRSKSSGDILAPVAAFPVELIRRLTSRKESKALAASSASIALSISSAFSDVDNTSNNPGVSQERVTGWQTAYAAARMAVEITKETADMFPPLKAVVGAMSVLIHSCDQTVDNTGAMKDLERRVHLLSGVLASPVNENDYAEKARRVELRRRLKGVITKLEPLSEQGTLLKFLRNVEDAKTLSGFVQELAEAIADYQVSLQQGMYERTGNIRDAMKLVSEDTKNILGDTKSIHNDTKNILEASELEILEKLEPVRDAGYEGGHHDKCLSGTRESVLQDILLWINTAQDQNVFWLNGLAGTGKSTIAQSISEIVAHDGFLGASYFCSRDFLDRRVLKNIFPTLAYQLACHYPHFRNHIIRTIKNKPTIAHTSLISQLEELLVKPLSEANISCVVVIDALDECIDDQPASAILSVLGRFVKNLPLVKFFITGRPEPRIRTGFRLPLLEPLTQIFFLHEVNLAHVDKDIRLYLTFKLTEIAKRRSDINLPTPWPRDHEIAALTRKSSGLFIFASTIVRFIESEHHEPDERLQLVLSKASGTMHEGRVGIDSLYTQILLHAFSDVRESEECLDIKRVLGAIVLAFNPLSRRELSILLGVPMSLISTTLRHLHSVMLVPTDDSEKIRIFHKSFPDFLQDRKRCTDFRFRVNPTTYHNTMTVSCLELIKKLKVNPCGLPPFTMNQDVQDLPQLLEKKLGGAARYACGYWARHLKLSWVSDSRPLINPITKMLRNVTPWIEVMSLENRLGEVIHSMYNLLDWLDDMQQGDEPLYSLAEEYLRLTMYFFRPIQQCAQQIYHTALPLSPLTSQLHSVHRRRIEDGRICRVRACIGAPDQWGLLLTTIDVRPSRLTCIAAFAQKIVVACEDIVNIYDAVTFVLEQSLHAPQPVTKIQESEDGSILHFGHSSSVTSWDSQTGGFIDTFTTQSEILDMVVSPTGDHVACGLSDNSAVYWNLRTKKEGNFEGDRPLVTVRWLSSAKLVVATQDSIHIVDVATGETTNTFPFLDPVWCAVVVSGEVVLVGVSKPGVEGEQEQRFFEIIEYQPTPYPLVNFPDGEPEFPEWGYAGTPSNEPNANSSTRPPLRVVQGGFNASIGDNDYDDGSDGLPWARRRRATLGWESTGIKKIGFQYGVPVPDVENPRLRRRHQVEDSEVEFGLRRDHSRGRYAPGAGWPESTYFGQLTRPTLVGNKVVCVTPPSGVEVLDKDVGWIVRPSLLDTAKSVVVSLTRNIAVQTEDSVQVFPVEALTSGDHRYNLHPPYIHLYPLGEEHTLCIELSGRQTIIGLRTPQAIDPATPLPPAIWPDRPVPWNGCEPVEEYEVPPPITPPRRLGVPSPLPRWRETAEEFEVPTTVSPTASVRSFVPHLEWSEAMEESPLLGGLSPDFTRIAIVYYLPQRKLRVRNMVDGAVLVDLLLEDDELGAGVIYQLTFDSETRFYLMADGPGFHTQFPCEMVSAPSGPYPYTIRREQPVPLLEPRVTPYTLDANCEWVLDAQSRKICWISPEYIRRGRGSHFWVGLSLVMLGGDGVIRTLAFKDP